MTPTRSSAHLAFIRSLPCLVCGRTPSEAAHFPGVRGMGQKRSDLETGPLCRAHHEEQHRIGWPRFIQTYELDVQEILETLRERPRLMVTGSLRKHPDIGIRWWMAIYKGNEFMLKPVEWGLKASLDCAFQVCGEYLRESLMQKKAS